MISKTIKYKLDSSSNMQLKFFQVNINLVEGLKMTQIGGGVGGDLVLYIIMMQCVRKEIL